MNVAAPPTPAPEAPKVTTPALPGPTSSQLLESSLGSNASDAEVDSSSSGGGVPARYSSSESSIPLSNGASGSRSGQPRSSVAAELDDALDSRSGHPRSSTPPSPSFPPMRSPNRDWFSDFRDDGAATPKVSGSRKSMLLGSMSTGPRRRPGESWTRGVRGSSASRSSFQPPAPSSSSPHPPPTGSSQPRPPAAVHPPEVSLISPPRLFTRVSPQPPWFSSCRSMRMKHPVSAAANLTLTPPAPIALASSCLLT